MNPEHPCKDSSWPPKRQPAGTAKRSASCARCLRPMYAHTQTFLASARLRKTSSRHEGKIKLFSGFCPMSFHAVAFEFEVLSRLGSH